MAGSWFLKELNEKLYRVLSNDPDMGKSIDPGLIGAIIIALQSIAKAG